MVALAAFMEVLDTTIANVALNYVAGAMGVSQDEASWVVTSYLVSNAIILTAGGFLAGLLGRKRFFLICLALFTVSSILCGMAWNFQSLLVFRILQGFGGGGMVPLAQSILATPSRRRSAVRRSPCSAWRWWWRRSSGRRSAAGCPTISPGAGASSQRAGRRPRDGLDQSAVPRIRGLRRSASPSSERGGRFDFVGFALVATFLGSLEVMLDRGLEDDWFASPSSSSSRRSARSPSQR